MGDLNNKEKSSSIKIVGDDETTNADVSTQSNKRCLHVYGPDDGVNNDPRPPFNVVHMCEAFLDGSTDSMNVNGSTTAVDYTFGPPSGQIWYVNQISLLIIDAGTMDVGDFGSIAGSLTNGLLLVQDIGSTEYTLENIVSNGNIATCFPRYAYSPTAGGGEGGGAGFLDSEDSFLGTMSVRPSITLNGTNGDQLIFRVRDNLTALGGLRASAQAWRKL